MLFYTFLLLCYYELVCTSICQSICYLGDYIPRSGITGTYGISLFKFLRSSQTVFYFSYAVLYPLQQCISLSQFIFNEQHNKMGIVRRKYVWPLSLLEFYISDFAGWTY